MKSKCIARLVRSGQQEGTEFHHTDLVQNVDFLQEVFKQFGDKLSSVLDITYRKPVQFAQA
jgi:hypothetical protein